MPKPWRRRLFLIGLVVAEVRPFDEATSFVSRDQASSNPLDSPMPPRVVSPASTS